MNKSQSIKELATALAAFQGAMKPVKRDAENPFFKSKYADLSGIWDAIRAPLAANGLSVAQGSTVTADGQAVIVTTLLHKSGEWIEGELPVYTKDRSPQGLGSGITYARRYALAAILGISTEDDDGEVAEARGKPEAPAWRETVEQFADYFEKAETVEQVTKLSTWLEKRRSFIPANEYKEMESRIVGALMKLSNGKAHA